MPGIGHCEHVELAVPDVERSVAFYCDVMGLSEITRADGTVFLGCGLDANFDLAVRAGGPELVHFAVRVDNEDVLAQYESDLRRAGVAGERLTDAEPGQSAGLRFGLPGGAVMELVTTADTSYQRMNRPVLAATRVGTPLDLNHVNLLSFDVEQDAVFLREVLGFRISDVKTSPGGFWTQAFTRRGEQHHDVAVTATADADRRLHHVAWTMTGMEHIKDFLDQLSRAGVPLELGPGRHVTGSSLFAYFQEPGGHRFELCAELAFLDGSTPTTRSVGSIAQISAWGPLAVPASFDKGT